MNINIFRIIKTTAVVVGVFAALMLVVAYFGCAEISDDTSSISTPPTTNEPAPPAECPEVPECPPEPPCEDTCYKNFGQCVSECQRTCDSDWQRNSCVEQCRCVKDDCKDSCEE